MMWAFTSLGHTCNPQSPKSPATARPNLGCFELNLLRLELNVACFGCKGSNVKSYTEGNAPTNIAADALCPVRFQKKDVP